MAIWRAPRGTSRATMAAQDSIHASHDVSARAPCQQSEPVWSRLHTTSAGRRSTEPHASPMAPLRSRVTVRCDANHGDETDRWRLNSSESARKTAASGASLRTLAERPLYSPLVSCCRVTGASTDAPTGYASDWSRVLSVSSGWRRDVATAEAANAASPLRKSS